MFSLSPISTLSSQRADPPAILQVNFNFNMILSSPSPQAMPLPTSCPNQKPRLIIERCIRLLSVCLLGVQWIIRQVQPLRQRLTGLWMFPSSPASLMSDIPVGAIGCTSYNFLILSYLSCPPHLPLPKFRLFWFCLDL